MSIEAVDLFCGVGGLTAGLLKSGIAVKAGYDIEAQCQFGYEYNNHGAKFVLKDVADVASEEIKSWYSKGAIRLLAGCAPCQPFSTYNQGKDASLDEKWPLLYHFSRLIDEVRPELVTMENVPDVVKHKVYHDFVAKLESLGYAVSANTVDCLKYGVPQTRKRHVLLASLISNEIHLIQPTHEKPITLRETIKNLPELEAGKHNSKDPLHVCSALSPLNMARIKASKQGGTWRDWPEELVAECHRKSSGKSYSGVYGRMEWDKPAPTITTQCFGFGNGRFGHPSQHRAISLREAALIQTFDPSYKFVSNNISMKAVGKMIGNAVPVRLGEVVGLSFKELC